MHSRPQELRLITTSALFYPFNGKHKEKLALQWAAFVSITQKRTRNYYAKLQVLLEHHHRPHPPPLRHVDDHQDRRVPLGSPIKDNMRRHEDVAADQQAAAASGAGTARAEPAESGKGLCFCTSSPTGFPGAGDIDGGRSFRPVVQLGRAVLARVVVLVVSAFVRAEHLG